MHISGWTRHNIHDFHDLAHGILQKRTIRIFFLISLNNCNVQNYNNNSKRKKKTLKIGGMHIASVYSVVHFY